MRLENVLWVIDALRGDLQLSGLPSMVLITHPRKAIMAHELEVWLFAERGYPDYSTAQCLVLGFILNRLNN